LLGGSVKHVKTVKTGLIKQNLREEEEEEEEKELQWIDSFLFLPWLL
jgi:hypothetical protein